MQKNYECVFCNYARGEKRTEQQSGEINEAALTIEPSSGYVHLRIATPAAQAERSVHIDVLLSEQRIVSGDGPAKPPERGGANSSPSLTAGAFLFQAELIARPFLFPLSITHSANPTGEVRL